MVKALADAIKEVYASVFYKASKAYMTATSNVIDEEKMGIVLQEVCGNRHGDIFYPTFSGVARSINYYPIGSEKAEDGIANVAFGLGKLISGRRIIFTLLSENSEENTSALFTRSCSPRHSERCSGHLT